MYEISIRMYYEDTDAGGVVYYANYLEFMERARTEWLRGLGFDNRFSAVCVPPKYMRCVQQGMQYGYHTQEKQHNAKRLRAGPVVYKEY